VTDDMGRFRANVILGPHKRTKAEENFLLAHSLGHFLLHIQPRVAQGEWKTSGFKENESPLARFTSPTPPSSASLERELEGEADDFAAALLLPKAMLLRAMEKLANTAKIADFFATT